jgi:hypothetical protein
MWLRSSGGYDTNDVASHRTGDEEHSAVYQSDGVEAQLASGVEVIELDHVRIQEHFRGRSKVDTVLIPVGRLLGAVLFEVHRELRLQIY